MTSPADLPPMPEPDVTPVGWNLWGAGKMQAYALAARADLAAEIAILEGRLDIWKKSLVDAELERDAIRAQLDAIYKWEPIAWINSKTGETVSIFIATKYGFIATEEWQPLIQKLMP
jgi:hypothetical protein